MYEIGLLPERQQQELIQAIIEFWNAVRASGDPGQATGEDLDRLERETTDCLSAGDVVGAWSRTYEAQLLMIGQIEL